MLMSKENMFYDGKIYQMPFQTTVCILYYRKDLFKKAGLNTNWNPKSWDELISTIEIIKTISNEYDSVIIAGHNPTFHYLSQLLSNESIFLTFSL